MHTLIELIDWCRYVVGTEPTSVMGVRHFGPGHLDEDYEMMSLDFSNPGELGQGPLAQISCGHYMPGAWPEAVSYRPPAGLQVACERGIAFIDLPSTLVWFDAAGRHQESLDSERPVGEQLLTSLVRKIGDLEDAYRALNVLLAARASFAEARRVQIDS
jgi:predicted dehydrogenase